MRWLRDRKGLSLVEMVIVVGLFGMALSVSMTILVNALHNQRTIRAEQKVISSARDALEVLAREIRLGYIDYDGHYLGGSLATAQDNLWVDAANGKTYNFRVTQGVPPETTGQLVADENGTLSPLSSTDIRIEALKFYVRPISDPYYIHACTVVGDCNPSVIPVKSPGTCLGTGICALEDQQPSVTIVLKATNRGQGFAKVELQTTVTVRTYKR